MGFPKNRAGFFFLLLVLVLGWIDHRDRSDQNIEDAGGTVEDGSGCHEG